MENAESNRNDSKKVRTSLTIDPALLVWLQEMSDRRKKSVSALIEAAVRAMREGMIQ